MPDSDSRTRYTHLRTTLARKRRLYACYAVKGMATGAGSYLAVLLLDHLTRR